MKLGTKLSIVRGGALPMSAQTIQEPLIHYIQDVYPIVNPRGQRRTAELTLVASLSEALVSGVSKHGQDK